MALSDPFSTTADLAYKGASSGQDAAMAGTGAVVDVMKQKQQQHQQSKQRQQGLQTLKDLGLIKVNKTDPSIDDLSQGLQQYGQKMGAKVIVNKTGDDDKDKQTMVGIYKALGIPVPQGKTTVTVSPGVTIDTGGGMSYTAPKEASPEAQAMKEISMEMSQERLKDSEEKTTNEEWDKLDKITNPNIATNRSPLGMAGRANMSAERALKTLNQPDVTNQEAGNVMADVASIYQAGSPTEFGMSEQGYKTLYAQAQGLKQYLTGQPQDAMTPAIKQRLKNVLKGMTDTNSSVINQNLKYIERAHGDLIKKDPDKWQSMKDALNSGYDDDSTSSNGASQVLNATPGMGGQGQSKQLSDQDAFNRIKSLINNKGSQ